jgi:integrase/recombinase XerD
MNKTTTNDSNSIAKIEKKINLPSINIFDVDIIQDPVEQYKLRLSSKFSTRTVEARIKECARIWQCKDRYEIIWSKITKAHVLGLIKTMEHEGKKLSTIRNTLSCLKGVIREAYDLEIITTENHSRIISVRAPKGYQQESGSALNVSQIKELFCYLDKLNDPSGVRDNAIIRLLIGTGLRRTEITNIKLSDLDIGNRIINVKGKGNKDRTVGLNNDIFKAIHLWIEDFRTEKDGYLFYRIRKCGTVDNTNKISDQSIYNIVKKRLDGINIKNFSTHDLRRTFATYMLERGIDLIDVMKMMGHASPTTTKRYDKSGLNKAMNIMKDVVF